MEQIINVLTKKNLNFVLLGLGVVAIYGLTQLNNLSNLILSLATGYGYSNDYLYSALGIADSLSTVFNILLFGSLVVLVGYVLIHFYQKKGNIETYIYMVLTVISAIGGYTGAKLIKDILAYYSYNEYVDLSSGMMTKLFFIFSSFLVLIVLGVTSVFIIKNESMKKNEKVMSEANEL